MGQRQHGGQRIVLRGAVRMEAVDILRRDLGVFHQPGVGDHIAIGTIHYNAGVPRPGQVLMTMTQPLHHPGSLQVHQHGQVVRRVAALQHPDHLHLQRVDPRQVEQGLRR